MEKGTLTKLHREIFSAGYSEARTKFLHACRTAGASLERYDHPLPGPDGINLSTDVASFGPPDASAVLGLCSGTHGVEGFAGSAIQTGLLRSGLPSRLPSGVRLVVIHAINPYGFAHLRRVNEDNVDPNRNFVDHDAPYPVNTGYETLSDVFAPSRIDLPSRLRELTRVTAFRITRGRRALQIALSAGQYSHPKGLFFGGTAPIWSNLTFRAIVKRHLAATARVAFIDFHTGLGPPGYGEMIVGERIDSDAFGRARRWWGNRVRSVKDGGSVSVDMPGPLKFALSEMLPHTELTCGSLEFGTIAPKRVFRALQAENWLDHHGGADHPQAHLIKTRLLRAFYPDTKEWRVQVWSQAVDVIDQALLGLSRPGIAAGRTR